ncbi:MAG: metal-dependent hydrolase [Gemmatimonadaceae bacterium]|nr:metal-dependent hydrolase [Gemmatimonadaceae bacterium]
MDNITHALAGALLAEAACQHVARATRASSTNDAEPVATSTPPPSFRRTAYLLAVVLAELPDADLAYSGSRSGMGNLGYLLHHRGHTHTVLFTVIAALVAWGLALAARRELRDSVKARTLLALSLVASLSHIALDYTNSYGVHPWWPFDARWIYGDAVFIVEPWLWIVALAPLAFIARGMAGRLLSVALLLTILVAAWRVGEVGRTVALVLTVGALVWTLVSWRVPRPRLATVAIAGWMALEVTFFSTSALGRRAMTREVGVTLKDVVLSPAPGNPLCLSAIVVTSDSVSYTASLATVAPLPSLRSAAQCGNGGRGDPDGSHAAARRDTPAIRWGRTWSAPAAELRTLARERCELAAALEFMRVPVWERTADGVVTMYDLRFGGGPGSFTTVVSRPGEGCPRMDPGWRWPRSDVLGG